MGNEGYFAELFIFFLIIFIPIYLENRSIKNKRKRRAAAKKLQSNLNGNQSIYNYESGKDVINSIADNVLNNNKLSEQQDSLNRNDQFVYDPESGKDFVISAAEELLNNKSISSRVFANLSGKSQKKLSTWTNALKYRYDNAKAHLDDASLVLNCKITIVNKLRTEASNGIVLEYNKILTLFDKDGLTPIMSVVHEKCYEVTKQFSFPKNCSPTNMTESLNKIYSQAGLSLNNFINSYGGIKHINHKQLLIGIVFLIATIATRATIEESRQKKKLYELQRNIDLFCTECAGAILAMENSYQNLTLFEDTIVDSINKLKISLNYVKNILKEKDSIESINDTQLTLDQKNSIEEVILYGEQLKILLTIPLF